MVAAENWQVESPGLPALTPKDAMFLACREKSCCCAYSVTLTGRDVYRLWRTTGLAPTTFCVYADARASSETWFLLEPGGTRFQLMLAKRTAASAGPAPCVFLWRLPDGHAQCGIPEARPGVCRTYPSLLVGGVLCTGDRSGCTCSLPTLVNVDREEEIRRLRTVGREMAEYREIVAGWNKSVDKAGRAFAFDEFLRWLLEAYA